MIYVVAPSVSEAKDFLDRRGLDDEGAVFITSTYDARGRFVHSTDDVYMTQSTPQTEELFFYLTCHLVDRPLPSQGQLW